MKKILFPVFLFIFLFSGCGLQSVGEGETKEKISPLFFEQAQVVLEQGDFLLKGTFSFSEEQLFTLTLTEPETLSGASVYISPVTEKWSMAGLTAEGLAPGSPIVRLYEGLCASMESASFSPTETGFIHTAGRDTISICQQEENILLLIGDTKATIIPMTADILQS